MPLYRADQKDGGRFWTDDPNEARYYANNSGYGGGYLWERPTPPRNSVLRLENVGDLDQYTSKDLDVGLGIWHVFDALERYPEIEDKIRSEGYTWIHYPDPLSEHPDARTFAYVGPSPQPPARLIERVQDTFHPNVPALDAQLGIQPSLTRQERQDDNLAHRDALVLRKEAKAHDHNLRVSTEATPELWSVDDSTLSVKGLTAIRAWLGKNYPKDGGRDRAAILDSRNAAGPERLSGKYARLSKKLKAKASRQQPRRRRSNPKLKSPNVRPPSIRIINR